MMTDETLVLTAMRAAKPEVTELVDDLATVTSIAAETQPWTEAPSRPASQRPSGIRRTVAIVLAAAAIAAGVVVTVDLVRSDVTPMTPAERQQLEQWCAQAPYVATLASNDPTDVRIYYTDRLGYALTSSQTAPAAIATDADVLATEYRRIHDELAAAQWQLGGVDVTLSGDGQAAAAAIDDFRSSACLPVTSAH